MYVGGGGGGKGEGCVAVSSLIWHACRRCLGGWGNRGVCDGVV